MYAGSFLSHTLTLQINGRDLDEYTDRNGNIFVEGRPGSAYQIIIKSNSFTPTRQKVVVSVDGQNVLTGDSTWDKGFVIERDPLIIPGWRIDRYQASQFIFSSVKDAYASNKANCGVIGIMFFYEDIPLQQWTNTNSLNDLGQFAFRSGSIGSSLGVSTMSATATNDLGTGWGDPTSFRTELVDAKFETKPHSINALYYDDAKGLARRGIHVKERYQNPFPGYNDFGCTPPKGR